MIDRIIRDASAPLAEALKGADALGVVPSWVNVRFRHTSVVTDLTDRVPAELVDTIWELLRLEFTDAGWGFHSSTDEDGNVTAIVFDHPSTLTRIG
jgi:hypothetical protein